MVLSDSRYEVLQHVVRVIKTASLLTDEGSIFVILFVAAHDKNSVFYSYLLWLQIQKEKISMWMIALFRFGFTHFL